MSTNTGLAPTRQTAPAGTTVADLQHALRSDPRILILDSPTVGVDISAKDGIYEIVKQLAKEGVAIILISDGEDLSGKSLAAAPQDDWATTFRRAAILLAVSGVG